MSLSAKDRVGSKIRCLLLSKLIKNDPTILSKLVSLDKVKVPKNPTIIPCGIESPNELVFNRNIAKSFIEELLDQNQNSNFKNYSDFKKQIEGWWLAHPKNANTPNWDMACIVQIHNRTGLVLVEAKAHWEEFSRETKKPSSKSDNSKDNNTKIISEITKASGEISIMSGFKFNLNEHSPYQLSNRFAWSWFLAKNGIPVVLMYLGFVKANEMDRKLFESHDDVVQSVQAHCRSKDNFTVYVPEQAWKQDPLFDDEDATMYSVIRSMELIFGDSSVVSINGIKS